MKVIKRNICLEELKSRIPALFPYIDFDEFGNVIKHKATDSVDGCYGKIVPDLRIGNKLYSYRTLMTMYYAGEEMPMVGSYTFEEVVGKFPVNLDDYSESQILVPAVIYAAEANERLNEMIKLKNACSATKLNAIYCCDCVKYRQMGGDKMVEFLLGIVETANEIAENVVNSFTDDTSVSFSVNLSGEYEDVGYYTSAESVDCEEETHNIGDIPDDGKLTGLTDSKLKSLRRYMSYTDDNGEAETPDKGKDWLYFYRKGYVSTYETINDKYGNIAFMNDGTTQITDTDNYVINLEAYGTVLNDITRDTTEKTITFEYYINAHLKAKSSRVSQGERSTIYEYKYPFVYESGGVLQRETYEYPSGGDIDQLSDSEFGELISLYTLDSGGNVKQDYAKTTNKKYEFFTDNTLGQYTKVIFDKSVDIEYGYSAFEYEREDMPPGECNVLFKEDYLMGVHYKPSVSSTVNIQRGNNAAFERHIRLGEVKTLEDMENYQNGSFFNIQEAL